MKLDIIGISHNGDGIGKNNNKIVFVPKSIMGDICDVSITEQHKNFDKGIINSFIKESDMRNDALCPYYEICGGCNISNLSYKDQLQFKKEKVINIFKKYLDMNINPEIIESINEYKYRNKITYHVCNNGLGLISIYNKTMPINKCALVLDNVNSLFNDIKKNDLSNVDKIVIRECNNGIMLSIYGDMEIDNLKDKCLSIYKNDKCIYFKEDGYIFVGDIKYKVSNSSFFQINTSNISRLYDLIIKYGNFNEDMNVIDLYSGVGSISLYIAKYVKSVLGIEIIKDAVKDANENARINNIDNVKFICGDVGKLIDDNIKGDALIVDPPRIGMDKHTCDVINNSNINKIVYVSCDPMTLVRDVKLLSNYKVSNVILVDMFPQTHHCESVVVLERIVN